MIRDIIATNERTTHNEREINVLREHFPGCFHADGTFDIERFRQAVAGKVELSQEGYELKFLGKSYARLLAATDTTTVIVPDEAHNSLPQNRDSKNIYISGDNLDALKHLQKSYGGLVKCIYIDPPYNTGSDGFVYNDRFSFTAADLVERLNIGEEQAQRVLDMARRGSASHSAWLMFMMPRLLIARDLLSPDGVIFISIDDNEQANLKLLCDDIFGEENLVCSFCRKGFGGKQDSSHFARLHEYVLCYANAGFVAGEDEKDEDSYPFTDENGLRYKLMLLRKWGDSARRQDRPNMFYPLYYDGEKCFLESSLSANVKVLPMLESGVEGRWRWGIDTMRDAIARGIVEIKEKNGEYVAYERIYEPTEDSVATKLFTSWIDGVDNKTGKALLKRLFGGTSPFEYPKPLDLIKLIVKMGNAMDGIVLDFFSGSATTAHAVMEMNAEDRDHRTFIMVQCEEPVADKSPAQSLGFKTIDEIGRTRIENAAQDIRRRFPDTQSDLGFKHFTLREPSATVIERIETFTPGAIVDKTLVEEFGVPTILATWLERDGYGLTPEVQELDLAGYKAYFIGQHIYLITPGLTHDAVDALFVKYNTDVSFNPRNVVIYGYAFDWSELQGLKDSLQQLRAGDRNLTLNYDTRY